jgi:hypothetical protein
MKGVIVMAKVFGVTPLELRPGVNGEDFAKFWIEEYAPLGLRLGWIGHVLKADQGERTGKYAVIWEIASVQERDRYVSAPGQLTEEGSRLLGADFDTLNERLDTYIAGWPFTDYIEIGKLMLS